MNKINFYQILALYLVLSFAGCKMEKGGFILMEKSFVEEAYGRNLVVLEGGESVLTTDNKSIIKLDKEGKVAWNKEITSGKTKNIIADGDDFIVITNEGIIIEKDSISHRDIYKQSNLGIIKVSKDGEVIWKKREETASFVLANSIVALDNGHFGVATNIKVGDEKVVKENPVVYRIDKEGNTVWKKNYADEFENDASFYIQEIIGHSDGSMILSITEKHTEPNDLFYVAMQRIWIIKIDIEGKIIWKHEIYKPKKRMIFYGFDKTPSNEYIITYRETAKAAPWNNRLLKLDTNGKEIWRKKYKEYVDDKAQHVRDIVALNDDKYVLLTNRPMNGFLLIGIDKNGNQQNYIEANIPRAFPNYISSFSSFFHAVKIEKGYNNDVYIVGGDYSSNASESKLFMMRYMED